MQPNLYEHVQATELVTQMLKQVSNKITRKEYSKNEIGLNDF